MEGLLLGAVVVGVAAALEATLGRLVAAGPATSSSVTAANGVGGTGTGVVSAGAEGAAVLLTVLGALGGVSSPKLKKLLMLSYGDAGLVGAGAAAGSSCLSPSSSLALISASCISMALTYALMSASISRGSSAAIFSS
ncbi:unnamed protein product, partial [Heterosigma akashiwo]